MPSAGPSPAGTWRNNNDVIMSLLCQNDVATSFRHNNGSSVMSSVRWAGASTTCCQKLITYLTKARGGGTPYVMGDTYVPRFWPPFFTLAGSSTIFLGYFSHPPTAKLSFGVQKLPIFTKIDLFGPKFNFFFGGVQFSAASGTPPSVFRPSTPPRNESHYLNSRGHAS